MSLLSRTAVLTGAALLSGGLIAAAPAATAAQAQPQPARAVLSPAATASCGGHSTNEPTISEWTSDAQAVYTLQCLLNRSLKHTKVSVDGSFGPTTLSAVKRFQYCDYITRDGIVGPQTWSDLVWWAGSDYYVDDPCR
ncbi:peptidoglycan-binding domain-containing protein [Streptomyces sp. NPDC047082]|uniref:peptidoglycan-binding domain-containing protein n=1 Tax=Streptomyces sp. NPDC047082 TaxID=3155259 RepID=UPI0033C4639D